MHAVFREAEDHAGRRVRVDDSTNFSAAFCSCFVLPVEKAHGAAREVAVAAAVVGFEVEGRRERRDVPKPQRRRVQCRLVLAAVVSFLVLLSRPHVHVGLPQNLREADLGRRASEHWCFCALGP